MTTTSHHSRIGDHRLSMGLERYAHGSGDNEKSLWKTVISEDCGRKEIFSCYLNINDFLEIKKFCDYAIETIRTDGRRKNLSDI